MCCSPWTFGLFEKRQRFVQARAQHSIWTIGVLGGGPVPRTPRKGTPMTPMTSPTRRRKCLRVSKQPPLVKRVWVARLFNALCYAFACGFPLGSLLGTLCPRIEETQNFGNKLCPSSASSVHHALCQAWHECPRWRGLWSSCLTRAFLEAALAGPM